MNLLTLIQKNKNFKNYFFADIISAFGTGMSFIGANWYILEKTGKNKSIGFLMIITIVSGLLTSPLAGIIADKYKRLSIVFWSNLIRGLLLLINAVLFFSGHFNQYNLYFLAIIAGMGWSFFMPASRAFIQEILSKEDLHKANALLEISIQVGMFLAAGTAGVIYRYTNLGVIILVDAVSFLVSNIYLSKIKYDSIIICKLNPSYFRQLKDGYEYLVNRPKIFFLGFVMLLPMVATFSFNVILPGYVSKCLKESSIIFGLADMSFGVGACLAGFLTAYALKKLKDKGSVYFFFSVSLVSYILLTSTFNKLGLFFLSLIIGLCSSSSKIVMNTQLMNIVSKNYFGRCMSLWMGIMRMVEIIFVFSLSSLIDIFPANNGFYLLSFIFFLALIIFFMLHRKEEN